MLSPNQNNIHKKGSSNRGGLDNPQEKTNYSDIPIITKDRDDNQAHGTDVRSTARLVGFPPPTDRGVTFKIPDNWMKKYPTIRDQPAAGLHWLSITLFCELTKALTIYSELLFDLFGELADMKMGMKGFSKCLMGSHGFRIAYEPRTASKTHGVNYLSFIIPGAACECIDPQIICDFIEKCDEGGIKIRCTRLDYKFDNICFSPYQFRWMIENKLQRHHFQEDKIRTILNNEKNELGDPGRCTIYTGCNSSDRLICCYDTHGFTRLEMRNKGERADIIFSMLVNTAIEKWYELFLGHIQDYIDIDFPLWQVFLMDTQRAYMKIGRKDDPTLNELENSFIKQWAAGLSVLASIKGTKWLNNVLDIGSKKMMNNPKYVVLLHRYGIYEPDD